MFPLNADFLRCARAELDVANAHTRSYNVVLLWVGLLVASFFCLRVSELLHLSPREVEFVDEPEGMVLSIPIRSSKTDRERRGETRSLRINSPILCPVRALLHPTQWWSSFHYSDDRAFPPTSFRSKMVYVVKWAALANGIPMSVANTHSLRSGVATALYADGIDWGAIRRWGRCRSFVFREYVWREAVGFLRIGE